MACRWSWMVCKGTRPSLNREKTVKDPVATIWKRISKESSSIKLCAAEGWLDKAFMMCTMLPSTCNIQALSMYNPNCYTFFAPTDAQKNLSSNQMNCNLAYQKKTQKYIFKVWDLTIMYCVLPGFSMHFRLMISKTLNNYKKQETILQENVCQRP